MSITTKPPAPEGPRAAAAAAGRPPLEPSTRSSRSAAAAPALAAVTPPRPLLDAAAALRILVAEVRAAVIEELAAAARLTLPALVDADAGNAGAALLRWLRTAAALSAAEPEALAAAFERGYGRALEGLAGGDGVAATVAELALAREVVLGGLGGLGGRGVRAALADPGAPGVPLYRPDVPAAPGARPAIADPRASDSRGDAAGDGPGGAAAEARDALEAGRRFFEALRSGEAHAFAARLAYPAAVWAGGRWTGFESAADCERGYAGFIAALGAAGLLPGGVVALAVEPLGAAAALIHARLARDGSPGSGSSEYRSVLTALETAGGWRIAVWLLP